jgi:hypothetical protein
MLLIAVFYANAFNLIIFTLLSMYLNFYIEFVMNTYFKGDIAMCDLIIFVLEFNYTPKVFEEKFKSQVLILSSIKRASYWST